MNKIQKMTLRRQEKAEKSIEQKKRKGGDFQS